MGTAFLPLPSAGALQALLLCCFPPLGKPRCPVLVAQVLQLDKLPSPLVSALTWCLTSLGLTSAL